MKSFHIVLKDHELGQELGNKNIAIAKHFGLDANLFDAVPGNNCRHLFKQHKVRPPQTDKLGHHGCFMSHFLLWKKCIELNETIVILEQLTAWPSRGIYQFKLVLGMRRYPHNNCATDFSKFDRLSFSYRRPTWALRPSNGIFYAFERAEKQKSC